MAKTMILKYSQGGKITYSFSKYIIEDEEELVTLGAKCNFADIVYVIHTGEYWVLDSHHVWYPLTSKDKDPIECDCVEEMTIWNDMPEV